MVKQLSIFFFLFSFLSVFSQNKTEAYIEKYSQIAINEMNRVADMLNDEDRVIFLDKIVIHKNLKGLAS